MLVIIVGVIFIGLAMLGAVKYLHPKNAHERASLRTCLVFFIGGVLMTAYGTTLASAF